ncbi:glycosyltransferase [Kluyvera chengduensis]|uniref:glycosyltransferase n=1 Tax=Kluyvera sp. 142359 TaxID=3375726 RepID=UPI00377078ED
MISHEEGEGFTVLLSLYNKESTSALNSCLESIYYQTIQANEVVIVYDGVISEGLDNVVHVWMDIMPIKVFKLCENKGLGYALNFGLQYCTNELIARMDTDDVCLPKRFEKQLDIMKKDPDLSVVGAAIEEFDETMTSSLGIRFSRETHENIVAYSKHRNPLNHMSVMFRKSHVQKVGGYQEHFFMEDYNLWLRLMSNGYRFYNIKDVLLKVRAGDSMITRRRGTEYLKSEAYLLKMKIKLKIDTPLHAFCVFLLRFIPRLLPFFLLRVLYKLMRK